MLLMGCLSAKSAIKNGCQRPGDQRRTAPLRWNGQKAGRLDLSSTAEEEKAMNQTSSAIGKSSQSASDKVSNHEKSKRNGLRISVTQEKSS